MAGKSFNLRRRAKLEVTDLLRKWQHGDQEGLNELVTKVYGELKKISHVVLRDFVKGKGHGSTMDTTALVNLAFPRLANHKFREDWEWSNRRQFYALSKKVMLWVLLDYEKYSWRHGGRLEEFPEQDFPEPGILTPIESLIALEKSLELLEKIDPRESRVIQMRFLEDYGVEEISKSLNVKKSTIYNHIASGLGFLKHHLGAGHENGSREKSP